MMERPIYNFPLRKILVTGGTGLVGTNLVDLFKAEGHEVRLLSTNQSLAKENSDVFYWNVETGELDEKAFEDIEVIVNLAGASIAGGFWTKKRKRLIYSSRVDGTRLLLEKFRKTNRKLFVYFGASAVGYYGPNNSKRPNIESDPPGDDFLANVCKDWEAKHREFEPLCEKFAIGRFSNILAPNGGMLVPYFILSKYGLKIKLSFSDHRFSWIHVEDVVRFISRTLFMDMQGVFNVVNAAEPWDMVQDEIYKAFGDQIIRFTIPGFILKLCLREMSTLFLDGNYVLGKRFEEHGMMIKYLDLEETLNELRWESKYYEL